MPDIDFQKIVLNLIPKREDDPVVFYASQYETTRRFIADLFWGDTEYAPGVDCYAEIDIRKNDDNLVVITEDVAIDNNEVSVILPVQAVTCIGKNLGQVKIYAGEDQFVAAFNFILEVQPDPLAGGVTSETAIDNLTQQIEDITQQVIGDDYYNKAQTDALLANKANISDLPDMTNYYTKTQTDNLLNDKADRSDLATLASKAEVTQAISDEDTAVKNWVSSNFATPGYVASHYYTKLQIDDMLDNIFPTLTASGPIASFSTALNKPLVSVTADPLATTITRCGVNFLPSTYKTTTSNNIRYYWNATGGGLLLKANVTYCISVTQGSTHPAAIYVQDYNSGTELTHVYSRRSVTYTPTTDVRVRFDIYYANSDLPTEPLSDINCQVELGSTATAYEAYNGQTVSIADVATITTLTGVNNVFTDAGSVTVQYKYMSM